MKITFLLSSTNHVRFLKRVEILSNLDCSAIVFAFERKGSYPGKKPDFKLHKLGSISHGSYLKRFFYLLVSLKKIRSGVNQADVVYTFGLDMLLMGWLSKLLARNKNLKLVYEVGDIREILLGDSFINRFFRFLEKVFLKSVSLLVVTSEAFYKEYFIKIQNAHNLHWYVIENKIDPHFFPVSQSKLKVLPVDNVITIGYFGVLRCERTWQILTTLAEKDRNKIKIYIRGIPGIGLENQLSKIENIPNIIYDGAYVAPDDLQSMYEKVDIVWASYPYQGESDGNWRWAKTIRFYESCFFSKPVIVQKGTEDCKTVQRYNFGLCLDLSNINHAVEKLMDISNDQINAWQHNIRNLPEEIYLLTSEHKELIKLLR